MLHAHCEAARIDSLEDVIQQERNEEDEEENEADGHGSSHFAVLDLVLGAEVLIDDQLEGLECEESRVDRNVIPHSLPCQVVLIYVVFLSDRLAVLRGGRGPEYLFPEQHAN